VDLDQLVLNSMKIVLRNEYSVTMPKVFITEIDFNIEEFLKDSEIHDEDDLRYRLEDLIWDANYQYFDNGDEDIENDDLETFIENINELVEKYSYLIITELKETCCNSATEESNFCNICGKKLK